ncbi:hypothetical protein BDZ45DRAFT_726701 [Acephala macrosclerotiorum]|nr:hypothetical protein BDZ45DRAFT_726701 [Acephala macrosclerotiorum]
MVKFPSVIQANESFARDHADIAGVVCVFSGATGGIGEGTLERMVVMLQGATFYVLGRSTAKFKNQRTKLESLNPSLKLVFLEVQVSLLGDVDAASQKIIAAEQKDTKEGLDISFSIQYYSRMRLVANLLPLLRKSPRPRVLSVLSGGKEEKLQEDDVGLEDPNNYSWNKAISHHATMTTLTFEYLAKNEKGITFMHTFPGLVRTGLFSQVVAPESSGILARVLTAIMSTFGSIFLWLAGASALDCGARQAFILTSDNYGPGAWRIDQNSELVTTPGVLGRYREQGWPEKVWNYNSSVFEKALIANE